VTFLFCDVEGSTRLWEAQGEGMRSALAVDDQIVREALESAGGLIFATGGDGFGAAFSRAGEAVSAALAALGVARDDCTPATSMSRAGDYVGSEVNVAAVSRRG
jgi:class 3 adenylate cyclase